MPYIILIILLFVHISLALRYALLPSSFLHDRREYLLPVVLVPLFGPLIAATVEILHTIDRAGTRPVEVESIRGERDIFWTSFNQRKDDTDSVPLEEAILLNDIHTRRKAVLNTFREDSFRYLDVLMVARNDEDVDTTHYATIQISKVQRQFQLKLQKLAAEHEQDPHNTALLDSYIDLLGTYLESPLPEKSILNHQRQVYARLLDNKLAMTGADKDTLIKKLRNCTAIGQDYDRALEVIDQLKHRWQDDEDIWIETLRAYVEWKDTARVQETVKEMLSQRIRWTRWGREQVRPWVQI